MPGRSKRACKIVLTYFIFHIVPALRKSCSIICLFVVKLLIASKMSYMILPEIL